MSPEQYGKLSILNTAILILYVFSSLNLQSAILNKVMKGREGFSVYLSSCVLFLIPFQLGLVIFEPLYSEYVSRLLGFSQSDFMNVLIICIMLSHIYMYTSYLQGTEKGGAYAKINILNKIGEILLIFIFAMALVKNQYLSKIYAQLIVCLPLLLYSFYKFRTFLKFRFSFIDLKDALLFSVPLIIHVLSNSLLSQVDRIIINEKLGSASAGIYSFSYNMGMCILVLIMAWNSSWQPKLYQLINENNIDGIKNVNRASTIIICMISCCIILFSKEMVMLMSSKEYYEGIILIPLIIIGNALIHVYLTYVNFVFFNKKTALISVTTLIALIVNIVANYILIPIYGILGSAVATVISYLFLCVFHFITAKYLVKKSYTEHLTLSLLWIFFISMLAAYSIFIITNMLPYLYALAIKTLTVMSIVYYLFKTKIYKELVI